MAISLARGERATLAKVDAFADGVAVKTVGRECFRLCRQLVDGIVLVDNRSAETCLQIGALPLTCHGNSDRTRMQAMLCVFVQASVAQR